MGCMKAQKVVEAAKEYRTILETRGIVAERDSDSEGSPLGPQRVRLMIVILVNVVRLPDYLFETFVERFANRSRDLIRPGLIAGRWRVSC
jgi:hypothetical protein